MEGTKPRSSQSRQRTRAVAAGTNLKHVGCPLSLLHKGRTPSEFKSGICWPGGGLTGAETQSRRTPCHSDAVSPTEPSSSIAETAGSGQCVRQRAHRISFGLMVCAATFRMASVRKRKDIARYFEEKRHGLVDDSRHWQSQRQVQKRIRRPAKAAASCGPGAKIDPGGTRGVKEFDDFPFPLVFAGHGRGALWGFLDCKRVGIAVLVEDAYLTPIKSAYQ